MIVYLACPYSHHRAGVREERYDLATKAAAYLALQGHVVYSPITMSHPMDKVMRHRGVFVEHGFWMNFDLPFMWACERLYVLQLPGWSTSKGVTHEIKSFTLRHKPIHYISPHVVEASWPKSY